MAQRFFSSVGMVAAAAVLVSSCTMNKQETPDLSGPSEFGTAIVLSASPDILTQDGSSQSLITVTSRDSNGGPKRNVPMRVAIVVDGLAADFGTLSARNIVTDNSGVATFVYTAPPGPAIASDNGTVVTIVVTPTSDGNFNNAASRTVAIRLVPPGVVVAPDGLQAAFTFSPAAPNDSQAVLFDASTSKAGPGQSIASYSWNFGDGRTGSGKLTSHAFGEAGVFVVTLTIADAVGRTAQVAQTIAVAAGVNPTALFTFSPSNPLINERVNFNASGSRAAPGRTITSFEWDFGDGSFGTGQTVAHSFALARSYVVVLTVTDDSGKKGTATTTVSPH